MENQNKKKKTAITIILIAVLIAALALVTVACSFTGSQAEEPEESASPTESAEPADASPKPASTAKPAATAAPASTAAPGETGSTGSANTGSTNIGSTNTGSTNTGSTGTAAGNQDKEDEDEHQHSWTPVYTTVHHEESGHYETVTIQAAYDEQEMMWITICNVCGYNGSDVDLHILSTHEGKGSYHSEQVPTGNVIHHDAVTEQRYIVDSPAYDEQVISHYVCSCGQTRSK